MNKYLVSVLIGGTLFVYESSSPMERGRRNTVIEEPDKTNNKKGPIETLRKLTKKKSKETLEPEQSIETKISKPTPQVSLSISRERKPSSDNLEESKEKMFNTLRVSDRYYELKEKKTADLSFKLVKKILQNETIKKENGDMYTVAQELDKLLDPKKCLPLTDEDAEEFNLCLAALKFKKKREVIKGAQEEQK